MMLYIWARKHPDIPINLLNVFQFRSCFLPHFYTLSIILSGYDYTHDFVANLVAHSYFYLTEIVPQIPET